MPSITYWNRLEPRPRSTAIGRTLMAAIRDPLWMLTRQWQFGEFHGEDAGSPAWMTLEATQSPLLAWRAEGGSPQPLPGDVPLEELVETEPFTGNLALAVELGQHFEELLKDEGMAALVPAFRSAYPIAAATPADLARPSDPEAVHFRHVVAGRAIDGVALYEAARAALPALPAEPAVPVGDEIAVRTALEGLVKWVQALYGELGKQDAPTWHAERLEYRVEAVAALPAGGAGVFPADPDREAEFDWYTFDLDASQAVNLSVPPDAVVHSKRSMIPTHVRFRGMPNARWWDFENAVLDFSAVVADRRDVAKLAVIDFMLVHGNDWFVVPFDQPVNSLVRIDALLVRDVFGGVTHVPRAEPVGDKPSEWWTMFRPTVHGGQQPVADVLILPPTAGSLLQRGAAMEDVRFLRDEMANLAWAIERTVEGGLGQGLSGHEREMSKRPPQPVPPPPRPANAPPLQYRIQSTVPENWFPLLPVAIDPAQGDVALELGAMLRPGTNDPILPDGRILQPSGLGGAAYRLREEEVTRAGVRTQRLVCRTRWIDGSTHLWIARTKSAGRGEGSSGLRFDIGESRQ